MLIISEHEPEQYDLGMDAVVTVSSRNTNGIMVWAWMPWYCNRPHSKMNGIMVWALMLWSAYDLGTRTGLWFGHGCSGNSTHSQMNGVMVWAWML